MSTSDGEKNVSDRFSMADRSIVVTGGAGGIGLAISKAIAQMGGNIACIDIASEPSAEFNDLNRYGTKVIYKQGDVTSQKSLEKAFTDITNEIPNVNGLVTAAGIVIDKPIGEHGFEESQRVSDVNIMGTFWPVRLLTSYLAKQGTGGSIVMIASFAGHGMKVPEQHLAIYAMSKAAVKGLAGPLAVELAPKGVRINTISPGPIVTPMTEALKVQNPNIHKIFSSAQPLQGMGSADEDVAPAVVYLLSDASKWVTGIDIPITGGLHAGVSVDLLRQGTGGLLNA